MLKIINHKMITNKEIAASLKARGLKLKQIRIIRKLTQQKISDRSGLSRSQIINMEKGRTDYTITSYIKYLKSCKL